MWLRSIISPSYQSQAFYGHPLCGLLVPKGHDRAEPAAGEVELRALSWPITALPLHTAEQGSSCLSLPVAALSLSGVGWVQGSCLAHCSSVFVEVGQSSEHSSGPVVAWVLCGVGKV